MVLDLMAQLDREFTERGKVESLLRELLDAKRNRKSEQLSEEQLALFASLWQARQTEREAKAASTEDDDDDEAGRPGASSATPRKKTGGRQALPWHLKRERIVHDLVDEEKRCAGCAQDLRPIGEETCERYEYVPASLTVIEEACLKYACACTVRTAGKPPQPIEKSIAGARADLCTTRRLYLTQEHVRLDGAMRLSSGAAVCGGEEGAVRIESDRHGRYQREGP